MQKSYVGFKGLVDVPSNFFILDNPNVFYNVLNHVAIGTKCNDTSAVFENNLAKLCLNGSNTVAHICGSIMSKTLPLKSTNEQISDTAAKLSALIDQGQILNHRLCIRERRYATLRWHFDVLVSGGTMLHIKRKYPYRVKVQKIAKCVQYLQEQLSIVPGKTQNAKIDVIPSLSCLSIHQVDTH